MHRVSNVGLTASVLPVKIHFFEIAWIILVAYALEMVSLLLAPLKYFAPRVCHNPLIFSAILYFPFRFR
jgi:hypothetical protein